MRSRRRSKRIAALGYTSSSNAYEGTVEKQQYNSKLAEYHPALHLTKSSCLSSDSVSLSAVKNKVKVLDPQRRAQQKCVSFSPCSIVVDGVGVRTETTSLAEPRGLGAVGLGVGEKADGQTVDRENSNSSRNQNIRPTNTIRLTGQHLPNNNINNKVGIMFGQRETLTAVEVAVMTGTNRCVLDDDVFETDDDLEEWDLFDKADYTIHEDFMSTKSWIALVFILITLSLLHFSVFFPHLFTVKIDHFKDDYTIHLKENKAILLLGFIGCLLSASLVGSCCGWFTWMVTYFDSLEPGIVPPSPLSPRPIRSTSSHSYHFGYIMSVLNGVAMFLATIWWMSDRYLIV